MLFPGGAGGKNFRFRQIQLFINLYHQCRIADVYRGGHRARVSRFVERMDGVKTALTAADKAYTEADKALRGNQGIIKAAAHLEELGVNHKKTLTPYLENNP